MNSLTTLTGSAGVVPVSAPYAPGRREVSAGDAQGFSRMMADVAQLGSAMAASPPGAIMPADRVAGPASALYTGDDLQSPGLGDRILAGLQKIDDSVTGKMQEVHQKLDKIESQKTEMSMLDGVKLMVNMTAMMTEVEFFSSGVKKLDTAVDSLLHTS